MSRVNHKACTVIRRMVGLQSIGALVSEMVRERRSKYLLQASSVLGREPCFRMFNLHLSTTHNGPKAATRSISVVLLVEPAHLTAIVDIHAPRRIWHLTSRRAGGRAFTRLGRFWWAARLAVVWMGWLCAILSSTHTFAQYPLLIILKNNHLQDDSYPNWAR